MVIQESVELEAKGRERFVQRECKRSGPRVVSSARRRKKEVRVRRHLPLCSISCRYRIFQGIPLS